MVKAEMILKLVMAPSESASAFVESYINLLTDRDVGDFQRVLEMKGFRRAEQVRKYKILSNVTLGTRSAFRRIVRLFCHSTIVRRVALLARR